MSLQHCLLLCCLPGLPPEPVVAPGGEGCSAHLILPGGEDEVLGGDVAVPTRREDLQRWWWYEPCEGLRWWWRWYEPWGICVCVCVDRGPTSTPDKTQTGMHDGGMMRRTQTGRHDRGMRRRTQTGRHGRGMVRRTQIGRHGRGIAHDARVLDRRWCYDDGGDRVVLRWRGSCSAMTEGIVGHARQ